MKICNNCKNFDNFGHYCKCPENLEEVFKPSSGLCLKIIDYDFERKANKNGNCVWYVRKKWKFWVKEEGTKVTYKNVPKFLKFIREEHPEIILKWTVTTHESL